MKNYDHKKIEKKWQKEWAKKKLYTAKGGKGKKFYGLIEFPYPSGDGLHVGHIRSNAAMDVITRKRRMQGFNVLYPIGWDAFGLPTENYAIKTGKQPEAITKKNTDTFRRQLKELGFGFDWSREINTTDPAYYKWTQWIFLQFYKKGLAYKAKIAINWCPKDKIGLANEEVIGGCCERCGTPVEKRDKEQWMLAITKYADRLDKDLDDVDYLEKIKIQQRNWIGKSEGSEIEFNFCPCARENIPGLKGIKVFTTRPDTLFGVTYVVLAPENDLILKVKSRVLNWKEVEKYVSDVKKKTEIDRTNDEKEKTGVELKGVKAVNPANGEEVPVWVADYVLPQYGTGAVMAVPAHDERDFEFAKKYGLPVKQVIEPVFIQKTEPGKVREDLPFVEREAITAIVKHWSEDKYIGLKWKKVDWETLITGGVEDGQTPEEAAVAEIREETGYLNPKFIKFLSKTHAKFFHVPKNHNRFAHFHVIYLELQNDQRQRISDKEKDIHDVLWFSKDEMEKFRLPESHRFSWNILMGKFDPYVGEGILNDSGEFSGMNSEEARKKITEAVGGKIVTKYKLRDWVFSRQRYWGEPIPIIHCEKCGIVPVPERDLPVVLPKVKKYEPTDNGESPLAAISKWVNVKCPLCKGKAKRETDTMPNWAGSSWYYLRYADPKNKKEFASKKSLKYWTPVDWYNGGMEHTTLHLLYSRFWHKFLYDLKLVPTSEPYMKRTSHGLILAEGGEKMSKSRGNVINPDSIIAAYGADTLRLYEMFMGPFDQPVAWSTESMIGPRRFLERVWKIADKAAKNKSDEQAEKTLHKAIKKVTDDIEAMSFNTAISSMMIAVNEMERAGRISIADFKKFLQVLAPFAPHIAEELWFATGEKKSIHLSKWPHHDPKKIVDAEITIAVSINGKVRAELKISRDMPEAEIKAEALKDHAIIPWVGGKQVKKVIYVPGRLVNIVI